MASMGRRRITNLDLPPRMHLRSGTYYHVTTTTEKRVWTNLGKDKPAALRKWADIEAGNDCQDGLAALIDDWTKSDAFAALSDNTRAVYKSVIKQLKEAFADFPSVADIKPQHVAKWQDDHKSKVMANTGKSVLTTVLNIAVRRGLIERNPAKEIENITVKRRKRYITDDEYLAIRAKANPVLAAVMDISYVTGARIGDILSIRLANITDEGLTIRQEKTDKLQIFRWNPALSKAIEQAKAINRPIRCMTYLLCTMRGKQYQYNQLNIWWIQARTEAGITDVHFHDIRGKAATDAKRSGQDYQALLGHTTKAMSDSYIKLEDAQIVEPLRSIL